MTTWAAGDDLHDWLLEKLLLQKNLREQCEPWGLLGAKQMKRGRGERAGPTQANLSAVTEGPCVLTHVQRPRCLTSAAGYGGV